MVRQDDLDSGSLLISRLGVVRESPRSCSHICIECLQCPSLRSWLGVRSPPSQDLREGQCKQRGQFGLLPKGDGKPLENLRRGVTCFAV